MRELRHTVSGPSTDWTERPAIVEASCQHFGTKKTTIPCEVRTEVSCYNISTSFRQYGSTNAQYKYIESGIVAHLKTFYWDNGHLVWMVFILIRYMQSVL